MKSLRAHPRIVHDRVPFVVSLSCHREREAKKRKQERSGNPVHERVSGQPTFN
jgi:hypothetical protein